MSRYVVRDAAGRYLHGDVVPRVEGRWSCPVCGFENDAERGSFSAAGWCQGDECCDARAAVRDFGDVDRLVPEVLLVDLAKAAEA